MIRALSIIAAIVALAVSAAPVASAGTPEAAKGACHVPGFMDYTDDSCMAKPRWGSAPASALASRSGGEVVSDFAKSKPKPAGVYDHGITQGRKPPPRGTAARFELRIDGHSMALMETTGEQYFVRGKAKVPRPGASFTVDMAAEKLNLTSAPKRLKDGTSNTIMWRGSLKPKPNGIIAILIG